MNSMFFNHLEYRIFFLFFAVIVCSCSPKSEKEQKNASSEYRPTTNTQMFWLLRDKQIEDQSLLETEILDMKQAGFKEIHVMLRATRYHLFDDEVKEASRKIGELCKKHQMRYVLGLDPRFGATHIVQKCGSKAQFLMPINNYRSSVYKATDTDSEKSFDRYALNEVKIEDGRYELKYIYPKRRDTHILTEVALWVNPVNVDKVYAYQRKNGEVVYSSIKDITPSHHLFINRGEYEVEVFGNVPNLPVGEWYVIAFPRFETNMYAYDSREHRDMFNELLVDYKKSGVDMDGIIWDEPGYYLEFGKYTISEQIYADFETKYGYSLKDKLFALALNLDSHQEFKVRKDYFNLLMDYVYGGEKDCWERCEALWGKNLSMGVHQIWHEHIADDMFHGSGDRWRGLTSVDAGYVDDGAFENYFSGDIKEKYRKASYLRFGVSLARFSENKKAHHNQWGATMEFTEEVPVYWAQLMAAFSNIWINHCYGYTGVRGATRNFGPGYPEHETWDKIPELNKLSDDIQALTSYELPISDAAVLYPVNTIFSLWPTEGNALELKLLQLVGGMSAYGIHADLLPSYMLDSASLQHGKLWIKGEEYSSVIIPDNIVINNKTADFISLLLKSDFPVIFGGKTPQMTVDGKALDFNAKYHFSFDGNVEESLSELRALNPSSICSQLEGAYLNVIPSQKEEEYFLTVMPVEPEKEVSGRVLFMGTEVNVLPTNSLTIYRVNKRETPELVYQYN